MGVVISDSRKLPDQLMTIERSTLRVVLGVGHKCPNVVLYSTVGGKGLQSTVASQQLLMLVRVLGMDRQQALRQALTAQAMVWMDPSTPKKVKPLLHFDSYIALLEQVDAAIAWADEQASPVAPYAMHRTRQWKTSTLALLGVDRDADGRRRSSMTQEVEQQMVADMAADVRAVMYIVALQHHRAELSTLPSMADVAWMSNHLVAAPFTSTRRSTANQLRVQLRGGMRLFVPWETFRYLRAWRVGCLFCDDDGDEDHLWTVTHLLKDCKFQGMEEKRREVWLTVVKFAHDTDIAGPLLTSHALDFDSPSLRDNMFALMVGEEVPDNFIKLGLEGFRAGRVAKVCRRTTGTSSAKTSGKHGVSASTGNRPVFPSSNKGAAKTVAADPQHAPQRPKHSCESRGSGCATRPTPMQAQAYQRLLNITGAILIHASKLVQDFVAISKPTE